MIRNDQELAVARDRAAKLERLLEDLRKTARPEEWPALSSGYRLEIERTQGGILDYLVRAAPDAKRTTTA
jgi:hypothetical protein